MAHSSDPRDPASPRATDDPPAARLTAREYLALCAAAAGLSDREIAAELGDRPEAVRDSIASAIGKLGARFKLEAIIIALRRCLIDPPRDPDAS